MKKPPFPAAFLAIKTRNSEGLSCWREELGIVASKFELGVWSELEGSSLLNSAQRCVPAASGQKPRAE
jgi:hypothetical protein